MTIIAIAIMIMMVAVSAVRLGGVPDCISRCYYAIGRWFTLGMIAVAFFVMPTALDKCDSVYTFVMCAGIAFVGVASDYLDADEGEVHYASAVLSALCSLPFVAIVSPYCLCGLSIALLGVTDKKRRLLWGEASCFLSVFMALLA